MNSEPTDQSAGQTSFAYPPKPVLVEQGQNALRRSLIGLLVYALLFYFIFDQNLAYIAAILLVIIVHEMGHFLFMRLFDYKNVKIFIVPLLGAFTTGKKQHVSQWQLALIILAGPIPGIILGSLLYIFNLQWHNTSVQMLANSFLVINVLNSLPVYPLDGGRLIETLFFKENHIIRLVFGIISIIVLLILCIALFSPLLLVIPLLIGLELYNENKHQKIREYLRQEKINYFTDYPNLPDRDYWLIRDCLIFSFPKKYSAITPGKAEYSAFEPLLVQHINSVLQVNLKFDLGLPGKILVLLLYLISFIAPIMMVLAFRQAG
ncbi:MAG TPA: site-2 protease family protein [Bacteroidia bacterium]|nr:site-2 protease family protein [Bacteroidia bacterium]